MPTEPASQFADSALGVTVMVVGPRRDFQCRQVGQLIVAGDVHQAMRLLDQVNPELVVLSEHVPTPDAMALLARMQGRETTAIVVAESPRSDVAVRLIRAGAHDYVRGPLDSDLLNRLAEDIASAAAARRNRPAQYFCAACPPEVPIVGKSQAMVRVLETIKLVAESGCNSVMILGPTGTGKELAARAVHAWRFYSSERFVAINCAALTATLLESELFGHVKGAFTGADRDKTGLFELAGAGTIYLDEITEMPKELQAKLLRVLQEKTFRKVGGTTDIACQAGIVASSNRNVMEEVREGRFRSDLYYRLAVFPITMPALADEQRRQDIPLLAEYFLANSTITRRGDLAGLSAAARDRLMSHNWPGNVRELRNVIERAMIVEPSDRVSVSSLIFDHAVAPAEPAEPAEPAGSPRKAFSLEAAEREFIVRALKETGWQRTRAAALLGITRATLHAKLKRYEIQTPASTSGDSSEVSSEQTL